MGNQQTTMIPQHDIRPNHCCDNFSIVISNKNVDPSDITCAICFQIYKSPRIMKCKHTFCQHCICGWGKQSTASCPYCRTQLRRIKGNYGKIDRKTQKKIEKVSLKCRNCSWAGSTYQYFVAFKEVPVLDNDDFIPCQKMHEEQNQQEEKINPIKQKMQEKRCMKQTRKQEKTAIQQDYKLQEIKDLKLNNLVSDDILNSSNPYGQELFLKQFQSPISRYMSLEGPINSREYNWEDFFLIDQ